MSAVNFKYAVFDFLFTDLPIDSYWSISILTGVKFLQGKDVYYPFFCSNIQFWKHLTTHYQVI